MMFYQKAMDDFCKKNGYISFITTNSWMFLKSFEGFRTKVINNLEFESLVDFGRKLDLNPNINYVFLKDIVIAEPKEGE